MILTEIDKAESILSFGTPAYMKKQNDEESFTCQVRFTGTEEEKEKFWEIMEEFLHGDTTHEDHEALADHCAGGKIEISRVIRKEWISE